MNEETNEVITEITTTTVQEETLTPYEIAQKTYTILSVLTFTIMIVFVYKYLKNCLKFKK